MVNIPAKKWNRKTLPKRILVIRLQAMGDMVATLPYVQYLRNALPPSVTIDFLTREETESIPRSIELFDNVYAIGGGRNFKKQLVYAALMLPRLLLRRYDVVIDMQNNLISRTVRKMIMPKAWSEFDRFSPVAGGERFRLTVEAVGLAAIKADNHFRLKNTQLGMELLEKNGYDNGQMLVLINPAGAFTTRNWNMNNYVEFARLWMNEFPAARFLVMGTSFIAAKAALLQQQLGDRLINLVEQTTPSEAFAILQHVDLVLSEDSGLMHMAWCSGVPTLAMFGSTRSDWARPLGEHTFFVDSSDLPCGNCMLADCKFGDVHCLTRYTPAQMVGHASALIKKIQATKKIAAAQ